MDIIVKKAINHPFPCYDCENIGEEAPRCNNYMTCDKWNNWAHEQGFKVLDNGNMIQSIIS